MTVRLSCSKDSVSPNITKMSPNFQNCIQSWFEIFQKVGLSNRRSFAAIEKKSSKRPYCL